MKNLFKNSFFSFLKNKVAIALLMVIIFLTTASFTMFNSATNSFKNSYNQVMDKGNRHDYTIKELYSVDGNPYFTVPKKDTDSSTDISTNEYIENDKTKNYKHYYDGNNYFMMEVTPEKENSSGIWQPLPKSWIGIKIEDTKKYLADKNNDLPIYLFYDSNGETVSSALSINDGHEIIEQKINKNLDFAKLSFKSSYKKMNFAAPTTTEHNIFKIKEFIDINTFDNILDNFLNNNFFKKPIFYNKYNFTFNNSNSKSSGSYLKLPNKNYEFWTEKSIFDKANQDAQNDFLNGNIKAVSFNSFEGLNIYDSNGNYQNMKTLRDYRDKIESDLFNEVKNYQHDAMISDIKNLGNINLKDVKSIVASSNNEIYKIVREENSDVDIMNIYKGDKLPEPLLNKNNYSQIFKSRLKDILDLQIKTAIASKNSDLETQANQRLTSFNTTFTKNQNNNKIIFNDWSAGYSSSDTSMRIIDPTSFAAVLSPTYASNNKIKPMGINNFNSIINSDEFKLLTESDLISFSEMKSGIQNILRRKNLENSVIWSSGTFFFITGIGITPDFVFPITSAENPIPNTSNQAIIYTNNAGYHKLKDSNPGSQTENYIAFKISGDKETQEKTLIQVENIANRATSWPNSINAVSPYDSKEENVILAPSRITFLNKLTKSISSISYIVTSLLTAFTAFIVILVVKKQIDNRKQQLGILLANGYSKIQIAISMMIIGLIVAAIPSILGYIFGHFMQFTLMNIFSNYWTLPIWKTQFSWVTFLITVVAPIIGISVVAFMISIIALRGSIPNILSGGNAGRNLIAKYAMKPIAFVGIKTKVTLSLIASNIGKLLVAFVAFGATIVALSVSMNSVGKFNYALAKSQNATKYEYEIDLTTPTNEAGLYSAKSLDQIFYDANTDDPISYKDLNGMKTKVINDYKKINWDLTESFTGSLKTSQKIVSHKENSILTHLATPSDFWYSTATDGSIAKFNSNDKNMTPDPFYLKNRVQIKSLLDINILPGINPWFTASKLMPDNQKNKAEKYSRDFINWTANKMKKDPSYSNIFLKNIIGNNTPQITNSGKFLNEKNGFYSIDRNHIKTTDPSISFTNPIASDAFREFIAYGLSKAITEYLETNNKNTPLPYFMSYNNVLVDKEDELYTHADINYKFNSETKKLAIRGLNINNLLNNSSLIKLSNSSINSLKNYQVKNNEYPVIINKYFSEYYHLKKGSTISGELLNSSSRFINNSIQKPKFKIIGIENTYDDNRVYTLQKYANIITGLSNITNKNLNNDIPFNGVLTKNKNPLIFRSQSMYSVSGIYPGKNNININNPSGDGYTAIYGGIFEHGKVNGSYKLGNPNVKTMNDLFTIYGDGDNLTPMNAVYSNVNWSQISDYQFHSILDLSSALMNTIQAITIFIALAFVLLISTMIIADNKKFIATLKVMGYRSREISKIFFMTFIPSIILALIVSIPITFGILEAVRQSIMGFGHVLIPLYLVGWEIVAALSVLIIGFVLMYWISARKLKNNSLLNAFQA